MTAMTFEKMLDEALLAFRRSDPGDENAAIRSVALPWLDASLGREATGDDKDALVERIRKTGFSDRLKAEKAVRDRFWMMRRPDRSFTVEHMIAGAAAGAKLDTPEKKLAAMASGEMERKRQREKSLVLFHADMAMRYGPAPD